MVLVVWSDFLAPPSEKCLFGKYFLSFSTLPPPHMEPWSAMRGGRICCLKLMWWLVKIVGTWRLLEGGVEDVTKYGVNGAAN